MKYDITHALTTLYPNAQWNCTGIDYNTLNWDSGNSDAKPAQSVLDNWVTAQDTAEPMRQLRIERDRRLRECDWVSTKSVDTGVAVSNSWKTYRQALRDLPASATPSLDSFKMLNLASVTWPTKPSS